MAKSAESMGRGFVLSHTPARLAEIKAAEDRRRRQVDAWAERLDNAVNATRLNQQDKNLVWRHIKANCPEQHAFLQDPEVQRLIRDCGAVPCFAPELIDAARQPEEVSTP